VPTRVPRPDDVPTEVPPRPDNDDGRRGGPPLRKPVPWQPIAAGATAVLAIAVFVLANNARDGSPRRDRSTTSPTAPTTPTPRNTPTATPTPSVAPVVCWNGGTAPRASSCARLEGMQALQYVVTADPEFDSCVRNDELLPGQVEVARCTWADRNVTVYVSRWTSPAAASAQWTEQLGEGSDWLRRKDTTAIGTRWDEPRPTDRLHTCVRAYADVPFASYLVGNTVDVPASTVADACGRLLHRDPGGISPFL